MPDFRLGYRPFAEQQGYFRRKLGYPSARWDDLWQSEHAHGFMVAGVARADVLEELRQAVQASIDAGEGFAAFQARFEDIVRRHGWIGGAGDESAARRAWRMRVIYQTNLRTSYMAARWEELAAYPYLRYQHNTVEHPREEHVAWDGLVIATDDPWWDTHYPPNGWGCRCSVTGVGIGRLRLLGGPDAPPPPGPGEPPPEWAYHPGKAARSLPAAEAFGRKVMELPPDWRRIALDDAARRSAVWHADWAARLPRLRSPIAPDGASPLGFIADDILETFARPGTPLPSSALVAIRDRDLVAALERLPAAERARVFDLLADLPDLIARATRVYRRASPPALVYTRPLDADQVLAVYVRLGEGSAQWIEDVAVQPRAALAAFPRVR